MEPFWHTGLGGGERGAGRKTRVTVPEQAGSRNSGLVPSRGDNSGKIRALEGLGEGWDHTVGRAEIESKCLCVKYF